MMLNDNILVQLKEDKKVLGNGLSVKETRGKRDIVSGTVFASNSKDCKEGATVYFPLYAANTFQFKGNALLVISIHDIIMVD